MVWILIFYQIPCRQMQLASADQCRRQAEKSVQQRDCLDLEVLHSKLVAGGIGE